MQIKSTRLWITQGCMALVLLVSVSQALQPEPDSATRGFIAATRATSWAFPHGRVITRSLQRPERTTPDYPHGAFEAACGMCHGPEGWSPAQIGPEFDHGEISGFELDGAHPKELCGSCHTSLEFQDADSACASCHQDVHSGELGVECSDCHTTNNFIDRAEELRNHLTSRFPLTGAHVSLDCESCHSLEPQGGLRFVNTPTDCIACHREAFVSTVDPNHSVLGFDEDCTSCHTPMAWETARFDHDATGFPLSGAHASLTCENCHTGGQFSATQTQCVSCHLGDYTSTINPDHNAAGFPTDCQQCHSTTSWNADAFNHEVTGFPLAGGHAVIECAQCHTSGTPGPIPSDCVSCHRNDYDQQPNHATSGFPTTCEDCHTINTWTGATFDHATFPITGAHQPLTCGQCHTSGTYGPMPSECVDCHQPDYNEGPSHVASNFSQTCETCHSTQAWTNATFDHGFFPLGGAHNGAACSSCHTSGVYQTIPGDCVDCHRTDYDQQPTHAANGFPTTCEDCHTVNTWTGATFDHTTFPITGAHQPLTCEQCHTTGTYGPIPSECVDCHQPDYNQAPSHVASNFPQTCETCHSTQAWTNATFDHGFFPLVGAHNGAACTSCHTSGVYQTIPGDCVDCHRTDYDQQPTHAASGFPTTCESCHTVNTWSGATFDHATFAITGAHVPLTCEQCHTTGTYGPMPSNCINCHQVDYVTAPSHTASNFSQNCVSCHTTEAWTNATFDHGFFPLTGAHSAAACVSCHTAGVYQTIPSDCVDCHLPDFQAAPGHPGTFPQTCETCHTTTTFVGGTFDHSIFPTTGGHSGLRCVDCHTSGNYNAIPSDCISCHQPDYQAAPDHVALNFPTDCEQCHALTTWQTNTFVHGFPISGPHDRTCAECHVTGTTTEFSCYGTCHEHTQTNTEDEHNEVTGYVYDFQACLSCHPDGRD